MTNVTEETITLAKELRAAYFQETDPSEEWNILADAQKKQWVQVAQFVDVQIKKATDVMCADCYETFRNEIPDHK